MPQFGQPSYDHETVNSHLPPELCNPECGQIIQ